MNSIGRKIYYLVIDGTPILDTGEKYGTHVKATTVDEDYEIYTELGKYSRDSVDYIQLEYGQYVEDFSLCVSYSVDVESKTLKFVYRDVLGEIISTSPLLTQIEELKTTNDALESRLLATEGALYELILGQ